ncbi:MAG: hypothetical protein UT13_C0001G0772 [Candidatus Pacebacteria bacterium GW2011_GWF2_38_9]|nr:MAG: hypothetical protein US01_C0001G0808 [candidate division TM6 bacterium GW2011_GWF2_28_16]KKQ08845.1 MAG: hypothetical protein US20_C0011G0014 [Candidatus Pacebacteria bacterium GW2011_GWF1_36_5]KKQ89124.1 MAG: hypothetical protein UT13_C0001G0772 [Candidatus Pacebacteria bacterium GW2011_GWF2_38_9]
MDNGEVQKTILDAHLKKVSTGTTSPDEAKNLLHHSGIYKNGPVMNKILDYITSNIGSINIEDRKEMATLLSQHFMFLNAKKYPERAELSRKMQEALLVLSSK